MDQEPNPQPSFFVFGPGFRVLLLLLLFFICAGILYYFSMVPGLEWISGSMDDTTVAQMRWSNVIGSLLLFVVPALVVANIYPRERFYWLRLHTPARSWWVVFAVLILVALLFAVGPLVEWMETMVTDPETLRLEKLNEHAGRMVQLMPTVGDYIACLFVLALLPALAEELFFRAALLQLACDWMRNRHIAVWFSALLFAFLHSTITGFPAIFICGLVLGYLFLWTGSLRVNVAGHFAFNALSVTDSYIGQLAPQSDWATWQPHLMVGVSAALLAAFLLFVVYRNTRNHPEQLL